MTYSEYTSQFKYYEHINDLFFANEFTGRKYLKQYIVMKIYNRQLIGWKQATSQLNGYNEPMPTLKQIWREVNEYFTPSVKIESNNNCVEGSWVEEYRELGYSID